jgi:RHS repeat-associated protein
MADRVPEVLIPLADGKLDERSRPAVPTPEQKGDGDSNSKDPDNATAEVNAGSVAVPKEPTTWELIKKKSSDFGQGAVDWVTIDTPRVAGQTAREFSNRTESWQIYYNDINKRNNQLAWYNPIRHVSNLVTPFNTVIASPILGGLSLAGEIYPPAGMGRIGAVTRTGTLNIPKLAPPKTVTFATPAAKVVDDLPAVPRAAAPKSASLTTGEPVSVSNGEYLETWHDFLIPGTFELDGARYMGLKLGLPSRYNSPLGPCQISMFDEIFSNPERGQLTFHAADGKAIEFDRPFNFLPSTNPGYPHLELKAPWLKELRLRDRAVTKHFRQYDDHIYRLEKIEDLNGQALLLTRDAAGALERVDGPDGMALTFDNDAAGRRTRIVLIGVDGGELELARYSYDSKGRMARADCACGMSVQYQWRADQDLLDSWHNSTKASETHFTYDEGGRIVHTATNGIWNNDRFDYGEGETAYLPGGKAANAQRFQYDEHENITAEIDALGGSVAHRYDSAGFRISTRDANGNEARTRYDAWGNVKEFTDAEGRSTIYGWGDYGELDIVIDGTGNRKTYSHDDQANVISETDAEGHTTRLTRDGKGRIIETLFANGSIERRTWDDFNRLTSVTDAKGHVTTFEYDAFNRLTASTDPLGGVTRRSYHAGPGGFASVSEMTRPDGVAVARSFDGQGQLASVRDGEGRTWRYRNGAFGVLEQITDPKGGALSFGYDIEGRLLSVTNALGRVYRFSRDAAGRVTEEEDFDGRVKRYTRDAAGQVTETLKPDGARLNYGYDKSGLLKRIETFGPDGAAEDVARFWYDGRELLVQAENGAALIELERDRNGRIIDETVNGQRVKSRRDSSGLRIVRELVGIGGGLSAYVRDPLGAVEQLTSGDAAFDFSRDALGRETGRRSGSGFELTQRFDPSGQLIEHRAGAAQTSRLSVSPLGLNLPTPATADSAPQARRLYAYDRAFAPVKIVDAIWGETKFAHDGNGQIASADGASGTERFTYDAARNVVGASAPASRAGYGGESYRATPIDNWTSTPGGVVKIARGPKGERIRLLHDACGRLIERSVDRDGFRAQRWTYAWDAHDRLVSSSFLNGASETETWSFTYDPFGRRITKVRQLRGQERERANLLWPQPEGRTDTPQVGTFFLWDGDQLTTEAPLHLGGHVEWGKATQWLYADEGSHTPIAKRLPDGTTLSIVADHLGTPKEMFDNKGALVWAADHHVWGSIRTVRTSGALALKPSHDLAEHHCPFRFPGQYEDPETGLYYNRHRHYDPLTGQYASPDPIGLAGGDRPQGYVANPGVWTDPLGLAARPPTGTALADRYPPNGGALGPKINTHLMPGDTFDRYGSNFGRYGSPVGDPITVRAIAPETRTAPYNAYKVLKPIPIKKSTIMPWFGETGYGTQYEFPVSIKTLLDKGFIAPIKP